MAYILVTDNRGREVARFHHTELRINTTSSVDMHLDLIKLREAVAQARATDTELYNPNLNDIA